MLQPSRRLSKCWTLCCHIPNRESTRTLDGFASNVDVLFLTCLPKALVKVLSNLGKPLQALHSIENIEHKKQWAYNLLQDLSRISIGAFPVTMSFPELLQKLFW